MFLKWVHLSLVGFEWMKRESSNGVEKVYNNKGNLILEAYKNGGTYQIKVAREQGMKVEIDETKG
jgi:hypothetical protein